MLNQIKQAMRPIITLTLLALVVTAYFQGNLEGERILSLFAVCMALYFGERSALKRPGENNDDVSNHKGS